MGSSIIMAGKKRQRFTKSEKPNWLQLPTDLLQTILDRLAFNDIIRFNAVCSSWRCIAQAHISSSYNWLLQNQKPWLMFPPEEGYNGDSLCFLNVEEKRTYKLNGMPTEIFESRCLGSSHGWLVFMDEKPAVFLFNPFSNVRIQLPGILTFPYVIQLVKSFRVTQPDRNKNSKSCTVAMIMVSNGYTDQTLYFSNMNELRSRFIIKAVLSADPSHSHNYGVIVMHRGVSQDEPNKTKKLAFWRRGEKTWSQLEGNQNSYRDITCYNGKLYALAIEGSIEVWDFEMPCYPMKTMYINPCFPKKSIKTSKLFDRGCPNYLYLVESSGDVLLVVRFISELEDDVDDTHHSICPYTTQLFHVFKMDFNQKTWMELESLGDRALLLGTNYSLSLSVGDSFKENSIYFTDDHPDRIDELLLWRGEGNDVGVFNLKTGRVKPVYECDSPSPSSLWIVPNPW